MRRHLGYVMGVAKKQRDRTARGQPCAFDPAMPLE
jgi:hypothetical protein